MGMPNRIDTTEIDAMRDELVAGGITRLSAPFIKHGLRAPLVRWNPDPADLPTAQLPFVLRHWQSLRDDKGHVSHDKIEPFALKPALGYILILDVLDDGTDYRYRLYGSEIARVAGFDMTGKRTSEMVTGPLASTFYMAVYRALLLRPEPMHTWHEMPMQITINNWDRIVLPLTDARGHVSRIMTCNMPGPPIILSKDDERRQRV
jgi:hypothetical protein